VNFPPRLLPESENQRAMTIPVVSRFARDHRLIWSDMSTSE